MSKMLREALEAYSPCSEAEACEKQVMLDFLKDHPNALNRENKVAHFTATAWIVNRERTKVLMVYHNIYNSWSWVGGHADGEEDLFRVAQKEIAEETGVTDLVSLWDGIYSLRIIPVDHHIKKGKYVNTHLHLDVEYLFEADEAAGLRIKEDENSGVAWIPMEELDHYVSEENMKPIYAHLNKKLKQI